MAHRQSTTRKRPIRRPATLSLPEATRYLNVTDRYVRRLVAEQRIAYFKVGRLLRFAAVDLDAYLAACRVEPAASHPLLGQRASRS